MPDEYVTGYSCPNCDAESIGIEIRNRRDGRVEGWAFRLPIDDLTQVRCFNCGFDIAREHWYLQDRKEGWS